MTREPRARSVLVATILFFVSGSAALVYEVLWMKELSLLFGNSAQAAAATLAAFFSGIAAGNAYWGRRATRLRRPLRAYGLLELGVTCSALFYFGIFLVYDSLYQTLFGMLEGTPFAFTVIKFALAFVMFFPAAFFMGGTLPVMTQFLVQQKKTLGKRASLVYAINTLGAASGAITAGFVLPQTLGFRNSYLAAMGATFMVAVIAIVVDGRLLSSIRSQDPSSATPAVADAAPTVPGDGELGKNPYSPRALMALAALSGFAALGLQVLWIRMFAQVLHNSTYSYAAILSIFLLALALGGALARACASRIRDASWFLPVLLTATGILVAGSPLLFNALTNGGTYIGGDANFTGYMRQIVWMTMVVIGLPVAILGILLPYLFKLAESGIYGPGETVGRLVTANTVAAIIGSVMAGFVLLGSFGLWASIHLMAGLYLAAAIWLALEKPPQRKSLAFVPVIGVLLLIAQIVTDRIPVVRIDRVTKDETLLRVWQGADATVAVVRQAGHLRTKLNNWYTLGSTGDTTTQEAQTHLPVLLHGAPERVFYLGLGTGITAGAALDYNVDEVVVTEIAGSVIQASREYFSDYTNGLYDDPRVRVLAEDGRTVLRGGRAGYDLIISDLFVPWKAGTGTLYSVEHYQTSIERLRPGGLYAQWLPLYQLTQDELAIIARTMLEVFPTVTMWRGNFWADRPVLALIGHRDSTSLATNAPLMQASRMALREHSEGQGDTVPLIAHYAGQLKAESSLLKQAPLNTDNRPIIEYVAPINHRRERAGETEWFTDESMLAFVASHVGQAQLSGDTYLAELDVTWHSVIQAGYYLHTSHLLRRQNSEEAGEARRLFRNLLQQAALAFQNRAAN